MTKSSLQRYILKTHKTNLPPRNRHSTPLSVKPFEEDRERRKEKQTLVKSEERHKNVLQENFTLACSD
jgi:hypothetical protein